MSTSVHTRCILPHPCLQPYVRYFAIRNFDTNGCEFPKAMIADHEMTMIFLLHSKLYGFTPIDEKTVPYIVKENDFGECCIIGLQTHTKGFVIFKGRTTLLNIHFTPVGFFHLFHISPKELVDKLGDTKYILSNEILGLHEQMHEAATVTACIGLLEKFLIRKMASRKLRYMHTGISRAADYLVQQKGLYSIKKLAFDASMTLQTFEVQFTDQVGTSPKYFSRLIRFGWAVNTKLYHPSKSWTDIAHQTGYYDQTHFIKDFKEFGLLAPKNFMKIIHPPVEDFE